MTAPLPELPELAAEQDALAALILLLLLWLTFTVTQCAWGMAVRLRSGSKSRLGRSSRLRAKRVAEGWAKPRVPVARR